MRLEDLPFALPDDIKAEYLQSAEEYGRVLIFLHIHILLEVEAERKCITLKRETLHRHRA